MKNQTNKKPTLNQQRKIAERELKAEKEKAENIEQYWFVNWFYIYRLSKKVNSLLRKELKVERHKVWKLQHYKKHHDDMQALTGDLTEPPDIDQVGFFLDVMKRSSTK